MLRSRAPAVRASGESSSPPAAAAAAALPTRGVTAPAAAAAAAAPAGGATMSAPKDTLHAMEQKNELSVCSIRLQWWHALCRAFAATGVALLLEAAPCCESCEERG